MNVTRVQTCALPISYFDSNGPCKHLWATVLAAEGRGLLSDVLGKDLRLDYAAADPEFDLDFADDFIPQRTPPKPAPKPVLVVRQPPPVPAWRQRIEEFGKRHDHADHAPAAFSPKRQILYVVEIPPSRTAGAVVMSIAFRDRKANGEWARVSSLSLKRSQIAQLPLAEDREIISMLAGGKQYYGWEGSDSWDTVPTQSLPPRPLAPALVRVAAGTGRCFLRTTHDPEDLTPLAWDDGEPWQFMLEIQRTKDAGWSLAGVLRRGEQAMALTGAVFLTAGLVFTRDTAARLAADADPNWIRDMLRAGEIVASEQDGEDMLAFLLASPRLPALRVPEELRFEEVTVTPRPGLAIGGERSAGTSRLRAKLSFEYEGRVIPSADERSGVYDVPSRRFIRRDPAAEKTATDRKSTRL